MGHNFAGGYSCRFCGCSIFSFGAEDECGGQSIKDQLADEAFDRYQEDLDESA